MKAIIIPKGTIIYCDKIKIPTTIDKLVIDKDIILKVTYNNDRRAYRFSLRRFRSVLFYIHIRWRTEYW